MNETARTKTEKQNTTAPARDSSQSHTRQMAQPGPVAEMMGFHESLGNRAVGQVLQAKLKVNQPGDKYEQEADRIAEMVMCMPDSAVQDISPSSATVQRKCAACESSGKPCPKCAQEEEKIQRKPLAAQITPLVQRCENSSGVPEATPQIAAQVNRLRGGGQPLPDATRQFFEPRFGHDFAEVRVHTDEIAGRSAAAIHASAYTSGRHVVFGKGNYSRNLLAHELVHVVQQRQGRVSGTIQREGSG